MKKFFFSLIAFVGAALCLSSCLGDGEEYTFSDDVAITGFSLGTLNCYYHVTTKSGEDSTYMRTLNCSGYTFYIDQTKGEIWNPDSLPMQVDAKTVLCKVETKSGGAVYLVGLDEEKKLSNISSTDSVDFSQPREFCVYNASLTAYKKYTVKINIHNEIGDTCIWTRVLDKESSLGRLSGMKAVALGGRMYVFGCEGGEAKVYYTAETDGKIWTEIRPNVALSADAYKSVVRHDDALYILSDGAVLRSTDGTTWQTQAQTNLRQIVAAGTHRLYAISNDQQMMASTDGGATWAEETIDEDSSLLPTDGISYSCAPLQTNANAEHIVICGSRSLEEYPDEAYSVVWSKVNEFAAGSRNHPWNYVATYYSTYKMPRLENLQLADYDNSIIALGGSGLGGSKAEAFSQFYRSSDSGVTWAADTLLTLPADLGSSSVFAFAVDSQKSLWIVSGLTGMVQKGRINRLLWKKED